jgi:hypothetical protein
MALAVLGVTFAVVAGDVVTGVGVGRWFGAAIRLFAVAEHVNYFHVQLGYQNGPDLRRLARRRRPAPAHLGRDLRRGR